LKNVKIGNCDDPDRMQFKLILRNKCKNRKEMLMRAKLWKPEVGDISKR
jgi:hypothetical protein